MIEKLVWVVLLVLAAVFLSLRFELIHFTEFRPVFGLSLVVAFFGGLIVTGQLLYNLYKNKPARISQVLTSIGGMLPLALLVFTLSPKLKVFPPIHDISSNLENPPQFILAQQDRVSGDHATDYDLTNIPIQQASYPSLVPLQVEASPAMVKTAVQDIARQKGWQVLGVSTADTWQLEAVARTPLFGFRDDVVIRVNEVAGNESQLTEIAVRSASRVGQSDLGANAQRILEFYSDLKSRLQQQD